MEGVIELEHQLKQEVLVKEELDIDFTHEQCSVEPANNIKCEQSEAIRDKTNVKSKVKHKKRSSIHEEQPIQIAYCWESTLSERDPLALSPIDEVVHSLEAIDNPLEYSKIQAIEGDFSEATVSNGIVVLDDLSDDSSKELSDVESHGENVMMVDILSDDEQVKSNSNSSKLNEGGFLCKNCKSQFSIHAEYQQHCNCCLDRSILIKKTRKRYKCTECSYDSTSNTALKAHMTKHTGEVPFKCEECNYGTALRFNFNVHMKRHSQGPPYKCNKCNFSTPKFLDFRAHLKQHKGEKPYKCSKCSFAYAKLKTLEKHFQIHTDVKFSVFKCSECNLYFHSDNQLNTHKKFHQKTYQCSLCDCRYSYPHNLAIHMKKHTGENPFKCSECEFSATSFDYLRKHFRVKHGLKMMYDCTVCDFSCGSKDVFKSHMGDHTGEKPYTCPECNSSFACAKQLRKHKTVHSDVKPYKCPECDMTFGSKSYLFFHFKKKHPNFVPNCTLCNFSAASFDGLNTHMRKHNN